MRVITNFYISSRECFNLAEGEIKLFPVSIVLYESGGCVLGSEKSEIDKRGENDGAFEWE